MTESNPPSESEPLPEDAKKDGLSAYFDNGVIDSLLIQGISFGAIVMVSPGTVRERGSLLLTLAPCQQTFKQLLLASINGFTHFKIDYKDANLEVCSEWEFHGAFVKAVDFGEQGPDKDTPPEVKCEICYEFIEIDGAKL